MSADTGRVTKSRFSSDTDQQEQVLQETMIFCVLPSRWLAAIDISLAHLKQLAVFPPHLAEYQN